MKLFKTDPASEVEIETLPAYNWTDAAPSYLTQNAYSYGRTYRIENGDRKLIVTLDFISKFTYKKQVTEYIGGYLWWKRYTHREQLVEKHVNWSYEAVHAYSKPQKLTKEKAKEFLNDLQKLNHIALALEACEINIKKEKKQLTNQTLDISELEEELRKAYLLNYDELDPTRLDIVSLLSGIKHQIN